mmetsp:Transcript_13817/g.25008  ORF Transcript_13817/g.25008 Transcript_13817/m.25008 type:complete len:265 (-) Transcript_13817:72-866(-)
MMMATSSLFAAILLCGGATSSVSAFVVVQPRMLPQRSPFVRLDEIQITVSSSSSSSLHMGGFGGAAAGGSKKKKKKGNDQKAGGLSSTTTNAVSKLKPKSQWDKYKNLKEASTIQVAVRVAATDDSPDAAAGEWCEIGKVRSEGDAFTELAVVLQRGLIAEHAKRLQPLQFLPNVMIEWGYASAPSKTADTDDDESESITWMAVDKTMANDAPSGMEKKVGFEGNPDKTGFYSRMGQQFGGGASEVSLGQDSNMLDMSVLPRRK